MHTPATAAHTCYCCTQQLPPVRVLAVLQLLSSIQTHTQQIFTDTHTWHELDAGVDHGHLSASNRTREHELIQVAQVACRLGWLAWQLGWLGQFQESVEVGLSQWWLMVGNCFKLFQAVPWLTTSQTHPTLPTGPTCGVCFHDGAAMRTNRDTMLGLSHENDMHIKDTHRCGRPCR